MSGSYPHIVQSKSGMWTWLVTNALGTVLRRSSFHYESREGAVVAARSAGVGGV